VGFTNTGEIMTDQEREDKISFLAMRIKTTRDRALQRADAIEMIELINQRPVAFVAAMEAQRGLAA